MKPFRYVAAAVLVAALGTGAWMSLRGERSAPDVTLAYLDGTTRPLPALKGQVVVVNFWATSCSTCIKEMPDLVDTYQRYAPKGLKMVAVAMSYDNPDFVATYAASRKLPFDVAFDRTGDVAKGFGDVQLTPTTYVIDRRGTIVKTYVGEPDFAAFRALIEKLLAEPAPQA